MTRADKTKLMSKSGRASMNSIINSEIVIGSKTMMKLMKALHDNSARRRIVASRLSSIITIIGSIKSGYREPREG